MVLALSPTKIFSAALLVGAFSFIGAPEAVNASSLTCANVRCAGPCLDTPYGPVCQPSNLTCANMLCAEGSRCVETRRGPVCKPDYQTRPNSCSYGYMYRNGRKICREDFYRKWRKKKYHHVHSRYCGHNPWTPPPRPRPEEPKFCTKEYRPVCAYKKVQCVKAPCPPVMQTFGNACEANSQGYTVKYQGRCGEPRYY